MNKKSLISCIICCILCSVSANAAPRLKKEAARAKVNSTIEDESQSYIGDISKKTDIEDDYDFNTNMALREKPFGRIIAHLNNNEEVMIVGREGMWYKVETSQGDGYLYSKWLNTDGSLDHPENGVLEENTDVYDARGRIIGSLPEGEKVEIVSNSVTQWKIKFKDTEAYIPKEVLEDDDFSEDEEETANDDSDEDIDEDFDDDDDNNSDSLDDDEEEDELIDINGSGTKIAARVAYPVSADTEPILAEHVISKDGKVKVPNDLVYIPEKDQNPGDATIQPVKPGDVTIQPVKDEEPIYTIQPVKPGDETIKPIKDEEPVYTIQPVKPGDKTIKPIKKEKEKDLVLVSKELKPLLKSKKIKVSKKKTKTITKKFDENGLVYTHVQGFCTDGTYWYVALMTSDGGDKTYASQETKLLKINIKTKKIVLKKAVGKIGHTNSLTYNPNTGKIYTAPCTKNMSYIYSFNASDFEGKTQIEFKDKKGKAYTNKSYPSFAYDPTNNVYIVKSGNKSLSYFDSDFKLIKKVTVKHLKKKDSMTGQAISCDGCNIFSVFNNLSANPRVNYIRIYDINGKYVKQIKFKKELGKPEERPEMEQLACYNGKYWSLTNVNGKFRIHKIKLRG